ncbi:MAG: M48 family metallopeptidase [Acutalibacteraceae bacterium]|nr:M48 family metallopeptidase [Acutalibacteraceae bacterium]
MNYIVKRSNRRTVGLEITPRCEIIIRAPKRMSDREIAEFVNKYRGWIDKKLPEAEKRAEKSREIDDNEESLRRAAREVIPPLVERYSKIMELRPASVKITSAEKRFGSCSGKNALCFSWRLMAYPTEAVEYVVVHELAHIKHHNHSPAFYALIEKYMPDYRRRQKLLKIN